MVHFFLFFNKDLPLNFRCEIVRLTQKFKRSQGSSVFLYDSVSFLSNHATGTGVGGYALAFGGGAISLYGNTSLFVASGVTLRRNRSFSLQSRAGCAAYGHRYGWPLFDFGPVCAAF
jgi:hypothetical protein